VPTRKALGRQEEEVSMSRPRISGQVAPEEVEDRTTGGGEGSKVFLFNCECHTFEEVITSFSSRSGNDATAGGGTGVACAHDRFGEVYRGGASDCDRVAKILGETGLIVQVL